MPIAGTPLAISRSREPTSTTTRKPRNAIAAGVRMPSETESTAVRLAITERAEPLVGVEVVREERAEAGRAPDLELAQLRVVHVAERLRALARRTQAAEVEQVRRTSR